MYEEKVLYFGFSHKGCDRMFRIDHFIITKTNSCHFNRHVQTPYKQDIPTQRLCLDYT